MYQEYLIILLGILAVIVLVLYTKLRNAKVELSVAEWNSRDLHLRNLADLSSFLANVIKDIAIELLERDSKFYISNLHTLKNELSKITEMGKAQHEKLFAELTAKYPNFRDFDLCAECWPHIPRSESFAFLSDNELIELFNDIRRFSLLKREFDDYWLHDALVSELEIENAKKYARKIEDTVLLRQLRFVEKLYYPIIHDAVSSDTDSEWLIATEAFKVKRIWPEGYEPETCYGVYFPDMDSYGAFTIYFDDISGDSSRRHVSFWRSDSSLNELKGLDTLNRYGDFCDTSTFARD